MTAKQNAPTAVKSDEESTGKYIEVQRRFKSTKKKRRHTGRMRLIKATSQETSSLFSHSFDDKGAVLYCI